MTLRYYLEKLNEEGRDVTVSVPGFEGKELSGIARQVAAQYGVDFVDAAEHVFPDTTDCMHLQPEDHKKLGIAIAQAIRAVFEGGGETSA